MIPNKIKTMTHASLFSGIGGAELAAYQVGWTNMFTCEIDDFCNKVLDYWFPNTERYHDIKETDFSKWRGKIDVLSGGPPCQAVSVAGKRKGDKDDRFLWDEFIRAVREIQPAWIVAENVYGILSMVESGETPYMEGEDSLPMEGYGETERIGQRYVLYKIISEIENEGYEALPVVIPACAVGAPHKRMRVWIICHRVDADAEGEPRREYNGGAGDGEQRGLGGVHSEEYAADTNRNGLQGSMFSFDYDPERWEAKDRHIKTFTDYTRISLPADRWKDFPTQSPVCFGDDELSTRLDGITFSKWRQESIKAYGNAWVPAVAYEIFKAIEEVTIKLYLK